MDEEGDPQAILDPNEGRPNARRLFVSGILLLLLPFRGPNYSFSGSVEDFAALERTLGSSDGGPNVFGPALYALPAGWILLAGCALLALSAFHSSPRVLRKFSVREACLLIGAAMLVAVAMTPVKPLMHADLGVGGTFSLQVGRGLYALYACVVMVIGFLPTMGGVAK